VRTVWFVDTSVLCELLEVPGKSSAAVVLQARATAKDRTDAGNLFILPVTAVIETGNHICNAATGRREAAERFVTLIRGVQNGDLPWALHEVSWDAAFLEAICAGSMTKQPFVDLAGNQLMGAGDVAILAERERFKSRSAFADVRIWTLDGRLAAYS
jgi:hypothetical protein